MKKNNPLKELQKLGQSIWLDFIQKDLVQSGKLQALIDDDAVVGVTSNPSIFEKAFTSSTDYDKAIGSASLEGKSTLDIYSELTINDIQTASDLLLKTYRTSKAKDGYVSLEVSPRLAHDTQATIAEAKKLWKALARPNVLIKVPGTAQGLPAIEQLLSEGINVNVTLLFGLERYEEVAEAYLSGLEKCFSRGQSISEVSSVASFFVSRIDTAVDALLPADSKLHGQVAIASAKLAYEKYKNIFTSERFLKLKKAGAQPQRLLWASTSTKDPKALDVKYVEALIGPDTVNTIPMETLEAYRDHGNPSIHLEAGIDEAKKTMKLLQEQKIDLQKVTQQLENEGVKKFSTSYEKLMAALDQKRKNILRDNLSSREVTKTNKSPQKISLSNCEEKVKSRVQKLNAENAVQKLWRKDASLWKSDAHAQKLIRSSLGWLHITDEMLNSLDDLQKFVQEIHAAKFEHVVHMGMGGSSLAALVFARVFDQSFSLNEGLPLSVLDSTDPLTIQKIEKSIPLEKTLFIVASKSGTTAEPLAYRDYFFEKLRAIKGDKAGENFISITDPGNPLVKSSQEQRFRRIFFGAEDIGGRYSALSYFGLVPAALMGVNVGEILKRAQQSMKASEANDSPALILGAALGEMALSKRNKVTLLTDKSIEPLGLWLEQLMAESTGKEGKGLIPIANEALGTPLTYAEDRLFVHLTLEGAQDEKLSATVAALKESGQPVIGIELPDRFALGREFFQWEFATALAGSILQIDAFDQPNVQESKDNTNALLSENKKPQSSANLKEGSLSFYAEDTKATKGDELLRQFFKTASPGDYVALMAFLPESTKTTESLQSLRKDLRDQLKLATTLGYGPRFLHSTGQLHKGGPDTGLFIQLTADDPQDLKIPGKPYSFGFFKQAQAQGDLSALHKHGRRALRIHLGEDLEKGLRELNTCVSVALRSM